VEKVVLGEIKKQARTPFLLLWQNFWKNLSGIELESVLSLFFAVALGQV
jgi:hypothetical protein